MPVDKVADAKKSRMYYENNRAIVRAKRLAEYHAKKVEAEIDWSSDGEPFRQIKGLQKRGRPSKYCF